MRNSMAEAAPGSRRGPPRRSAISRMSASQSAMSRCGRSPSKRASGMRVIDASSASPRCGPLRRRLRWSRHPDTDRAPAGSRHRAHGCRAPQTEPPALTSHSADNTSTYQPEQRGRFECRPGVTFPADSHTVAESVKLAHYGSPSRPSRTPSHTTGLSLFFFITLTNCRCLWVVRTQRPFQIGKAFGEFSELIPKLEVTVEHPRNKRSSRTNQSSWLLFY